MFEYRAMIDNVVDGDTVDVRVDLGFKVETKQRIRLAGIDTPERGQIGYHEAKAKLTELLSGKETTMRSSKVSKWGYYLGDFYTADGTHINQLMIDLKLAKPYDGGTKS